MAVEPQLLTQALRTPDNQDVTATPIARAVILPDPENAAALVPSLARPGTLEGRNARKILCEFEPAAVPHLLQSLAAADDPQTREGGLEVFWALAAFADVRSRRELIDGSSADLAVLFRDTSPLPDTLPAYIERDFTGRICDLAYLVVRELLDTEFNQASFRALSDEGRDQEIRRFRFGTSGAVS
jgi:hypothetical protein